jgi:hypothetical protein
VETTTAALAAAAPSPAEVSAQVRTARGACSTEATRQQLELVDFVTFNRLDDSNWDSTMRVRRKGRLVRLGCRYDLKAAVTYIYEPSAADGGNPWGAAGPPKAATPTPPPTPPTPPAVAEGRNDSRAPSPRPERKAEPAKTEPPKAEPPRSEPKAKPAPPPVPGSNINLNAIADTSARSAIARTRDACLAEAARRKIAFDDFDAFRRVQGTRWEALLLTTKGKGSSRSCQVDVSTGKATIK